MRAPVTQVLFAAAALLSAAGCMAPMADKRPAASVTLEPRSGSNVSGRLEMVQLGSTVHVQGQVSGLKPNAEHGFHIHEKGDCSAPDAASAAGHFNPGSAPHGRPGSGAGHHAGDLTSLRTDAAGNVRIDQMVQGVTLASGAQGIVGRSVVVHRDPDDYSSQPAGNSGPRVACGVIVQG